MIALALFVLAPLAETPARVFEVRSRDIIAAWEWEAPERRREAR